MLDPIKDRALLDLDDVVHELADGHYVSGSPSDYEKFDIRGLRKYCKEKGIDVTQLSDEETKRFIVK